MQILFKKTIDQCRMIGARGGRARARNLRMRKLQITPKTPVPPNRPETAAEAVALLDRQFPWLIGAEKSRWPKRGGIHGSRSVL